MVEKANSAWRYETFGLNTFGQRSLIIPGKLSDSLSPDAMFLFCRLQRDHLWCDEFLMSKNYGKAFGMGWRRLANAVKELVVAGVLQRLTHGGRFEGDAAMYAWIKKRPDIYHLQEGKR